MQVVYWQHMKTAHWVVTLSMLLLGLIHSFMGFYCKVLNENALWFVGAGVAIIFAGLFNLLVCIQTNKTARIITMMVNTLMAALFVFATQVLHGPQVYIGITLFVLAAILTFLRKVPTDETAYKSYSLKDSNV